MKKLVALMAVLTLAISAFAGWTAAAAEEEKDGIYAKLEELGIYGQGRSRKLH